LTEKEKLLPTAAIYKSAGLWVSNEWNFSQLSTVMTGKHFIFAALIYSRGTLATI